MSQAAELLNSLSGDSVATYTANAEEEHIVVGSDRFIRIPDSLKRLGVQRDKDIETVTFDCPRYWDKHDLSQMVIYVNYVLPNGEDGRYPVQNVVAIGTMLHFDWTIGDYVTQYQGQISFLICAVMTDEEGNEKLHWNSELNQEAYISEGLECSESPIHQYPDIITHLLTRMDEVEAIATPGAMQGYTDAWLEANHARILAEIEAKGKATLDTIPEDYTETHNMAEESVRTKADAIVGTAEGTVISVADSSDDHIRNLRVFGKTTQVTTTGTQLFNPYAEQNNSFGNATVENNGSRITVTGTYYVSWPLVLKAGVTYYINFNTVGAATNRAIRFEYPDKEITETVTNPASFTPTKDTVSVYLYAGLGTEDAIIYENVQISEGSSALPWEPYSGGVASPSPDWPQGLDSIDDTTVDICGGNLFNFKGITATDSITVNPDGTLTVAVYAAPTGKTLKQLAPSLKVGSRYKLTMDTESTNNFIYLLDVKSTWDKGATITMTDAILNSKVYVYGVNGDAPTIIRNIAIVPEGVVYGGAPYVEPQHIAVNRVLSGIPVTSDGNYTDENGQQWVCDEIDFERGMYIQRIGKMTCIGDTSEYWSYQENIGVQKTPVFVLTISKLNTIRESTDRAILCENYRAGAKLPISDCEFWPKDTYFGVKQVAFRNDAFTNLDSWKQHLVDNPISLIYELTTPIETQLTTAELEDFKVLRSNRPNTTVLNDSGAPMQLTYNVDTKTYVDNGIQRTVAEVMEAIANGSY